MKFRHLATATCAVCRLPMIPCDGADRHPLCDRRPGWRWTPEQMAVWLATPPTQDTPVTAPSVAVEPRTERAA